MAVIETNGLTKVFNGSVVAVEDLDLEIFGGEVYGFLGPNGAGKSTTINLLLDFIEPTSGGVRIFGIDPREDSIPIRERIGLLPDKASLYPQLTGREHLRFAMESKGVDEDPGSILKRVGLSGDDADRPAGEYSTGMAQRLGLGMALVGDPDLLILDEPSSGLDPTGMKEIRELIRTEAADGTAVFFSSHILAEVEAVCDRVGILNDGRLVAQNSVEALRDDLVGSSTIRLSVDTVPEGGFGLSSLSSVVDVTKEGGTVDVVCETPAAKIDVVERVNGRATVTDIVSSDTSLEKVFETYTDAGREADGRVDDDGGGVLTEAAE